MISVTPKIWRWILLFPGAWRSDIGKDNSKRYLKKILDKLGKSLPCLTKEVLNSLSVSVPGQIKM